MSEAASEAVLLREKSAEVATFTLNRPRAMNALSFELRVALTRAFREAQADPAVRAVILTGAGRAFCAGIDLKELGAATPREGNPRDADVLAAMAGFEGPVIGAINGVAVTGGFELALACDVLIASTAARFADTHARVGILPGWGLSQRLSRAIGIYRAKELSLTGNYLSAPQAAEWGLINRVVTPEELLPTCHALAREMLSCVPEALVGYKRIIDRGFGASFDEGLRIEQELSREANRNVSADSIERRRTRVIERGRQQTTES